MSCCVKMERGRLLGENEGNHQQGVIVVCVLGGGSLLLLLIVKLYDDFRKKIRKKERDTVTPHDSLRHCQRTPKFHESVDLALPSLFAGNDTSFFNKFWNELVMWHPYLSVFTQRPRRSSKNFTCFIIVNIHNIDRVCANVDVWCAPSADYWYSS